MLSCWCTACSLRSTPRAIRDRPEGLSSRPAWKSRTPAAWDNMSRNGRRQNNKPNMKENKNKAVCKAARAVYLKTPLLLGLNSSRRPCADYTQIRLLLASAFPLAHFECPLDPRLAYCTLYFQTFAWGLSPVNIATILQLLLQGSSIKIYYVHIIKDENYSFTDSTAS